MNNPKLLILLTIIFWSFGSLLTRLISINAQLLSLNVLLFFSFLFFLIYSLFQYKKNFLKKLIHVKLAYIFFGLFGYFFYYLGLVQSFHEFHSASDTAILNYTFPIFTVLFTEFLFVIPVVKSFMIKGIEYTGVLLGFLAVIIVATHGHMNPFQFTNIRAVLWGLSAGVSYGIFSAYSSSVQRENQSMFLLTSTFGSWILASLISLSELSALRTFTAYDYLFEAILAFVVNGLGYITWARANRLTNILRIPISSIVSLMYILPLIALFLINAFLKENAFSHPYFLFSLGCVIFSSFLCQKPETVARFFGIHAVLTYPLVSSKLKKQIKSRVMGRDLAR